ncbi:MAG TPA: DUF5939 domain-containing protein [Chloroflexota bacterium]
MKAPSASLHFEARLEIDAPAEAVWPLVADTERLNRAIGMPSVTYQARERAEGGSTTVGEFRFGRLVLARWDELPFEWQAPRFYFVDRRYHSGPLRRFVGGADLQPLPGGGTAVRIWTDLEPRNVLGRLLAQVAIGPIAVRRASAQVARFEKFLKGEIGDPFPTLRSSAAEPEPLPTPDLRGAQGAWRRLADSFGNLSLVGRLRAHVEQAADPDVLHMRPFALADRWQHDRLEVLALFLHAASAGALTLSWDLLCPHCRVAKASYGSLVDLQPQAYCESCAVTYEADFDRNVEVRFSVSPAVRRATDNVYCESGPMATPHRVARMTVPAGGVRPILGDLDGGRYRLASRQSQGSVSIEAGSERQSPAATRVVNIYTDRMGPATLGVSTGAVKLSLVNHLDVPVTIDLERTEWPDTIASAATVSTLPAFRDLFSAEVLAAGRQVAIGRLTFVCASLAGSTAMYAALGQARGFRLVQEHLALTRSIVRAHHGVVLKTMGDTLMATFPSTATAVDAGLAIRRGLTRLDSAGAVDMTRLLKIGIHEGACVAATDDGRLDYFGLAPNTAAALAHSAGPGEIVLSEVVCEEPEVAASLGLADAPDCLDSVELSSGVLRVHRVPAQLPVSQASTSAA